MMSTRSLGMVAAVACALLQPVTASRGDEASEQHEGQVPVEVQRRTADRFLAGNHHFFRQLDGSLVMSSSYATLMSSVENPVRWVEVAKENYGTRPERYLWPVGGDRNRMYFTTSAKDYKTRVLCFLEPGDIEHRPVREMPKRLAAFASGQVGAIEGDNGSVLLTTDGGATWHQTGSLVTSEGITRLHWTSDTRLVVADLYSIRCFERSGNTLTPSWSKEGLPPGREHLEFDGQYVWAGSREILSRLDPVSGEIEATIKLEYPVSAEGIAACRTCLIIWHYEHKVIGSGGTLIVKASLWRQTNRANDYESIPIDLSVTPIAAVELAQSTCVVFDRIGRGHLLDLATGELRAQELQVVYAPTTEPPEDSERPSLDKFMTKIALERRLPQNVRDAFTKESLEVLRREDLTPKQKVDWQLEEVWRLLEQEEPGQRLYGLQKLLIVDKQRALAFDFFDDKTSQSMHFPPLVTIRRSEAAKERIARYYPDRGRWPVLPVGAFIWDWSRNMLFVIDFSVFRDGMYATMIRRWPIHSLRAGERLDPVDQAKVEELYKCEWKELSVGPGGRTKRIPERVGLGPAGRIGNGGALPDEEQTQYLEGPRREVVVDIAAEDECGVTLWMTVEGELTRWTYRGSEYEFGGRLPVRLEGPFLMGQGGRAVMAQRGNQWWRYEIGADGAAGRVIAKVSEGEPLFLIVDNVGERDWFVQGRDVMDERGEVVAEVPEDLVGESMLVWLADFVWRASGEKAERGGAQGEDRGEDQ